MAILSPMFILLIVVLIITYWLIAFYQPKGRIKLREDYLRANREAIEYKELNKQCDRTIKMLQEMIDKIDRLEKEDK